MVPPNISEEGPRQEAIHKASGVTAGEKYLGHLCERTFLSLWSYPGVYRDQGKKHQNGDGKEICDLLVVFDRHVIIFSDKHCQLQKTGDTKLDWQRWFRRAVQKSADQAWGAERWIRQNPDRVFLDRECKKPLPIGLPPIAEAVFHLVVVAHGISARIKQAFNSSGSLMLDTDLKGSASHVEPFWVGDLDPQRTFIHILDDDSLFTLMRERDTISDFVGYLAKREKLFRGRKRIVAPGEEQLLAVYLRHMNPQNEHDFVFDIRPGQTHSGIFVPEGHWEAFQNAPERVAQLKHDRVSYAWDHLIEKFNYYALRGELYGIPDGGIRDTERALRFMAQEPRWKRRAYAKSLLEMLATTPSDKRRLRVHERLEESGPYYVFLILPHLSSMTDEQYRFVRQEFLMSCCHVVRLKNPGAKDIIGFATEPGLDNETRSEDIAYFDGRTWTPEMEEAAKEESEKLGILVSPTRTKSRIQEYPDAPAPGSKIKNPRNKPCPCGSGKKYKHCCL